MYCFSRAVQLMH